MKVTERIRQLDERENENYRIKTFSKNYQEVIDKIRKEWYYYADQKIRKLGNEKWNS